jgi:hypothetical protein
MKARRFTTASITSARFQLELAHKLEFVSLVVVLLLGLNALAYVSVAQTTSAATLVQDTYGLTPDCTGQFICSASTAFSLPVKLGDVIVVVGVGSAKGGLNGYSFSAGATDSISSSYSQVTSSNNNGIYTYVWDATLSKSGSDTVSVSGYPANWLELFAFEISGVTTTQAQSGSATGACFNPCSVSTSAVNYQPGAFFLAGVADNAPANTVSWTAGTGFALFQNPSLTQIATEYSISGVSSSTTFPMTGSGAGCSNGCYWTAVGVALEPGTPSTTTTTTTSISQFMGTRIIQDNESKGACPYNSKCTEVVTLPSSVSRGNVMIVGIYVDTSVGPTVPQVSIDISDSLSSSYSEAASVTNFYLSSYIYIAELTTTGPDSVTVTPSEPGLNGFSTFVFEVSGVSPTGATYGSGASSTSCADYSCALSTSPVSFQPGAFLIAVIGTDNQRVASGGAGFTFTQASQFAASEYSIGDASVSSPTTFPAASTGGNAEAPNDWTDIGIALQPSSTQTTTTTTTVITTSSSAITTSTGPVATSVHSSTTFLTPTSTASSSLLTTTSLGNIGVPEFPGQVLVASAVTIILVLSYFLVRLGEGRKATAREGSKPR